MAAATVGWFRVRVSMARIAALMVEDHNPSDTMLDFMILERVIRRMFISS